jgi:hypothetical protein
MLFISILFISILLALQLAHNLACPKTPKSVVCNLYVYVCICMYVICMYVCMYIRMYVFIYTHTHTHIHAYIHTYIHTYNIYNWLAAEWVDRFACQSPNQRSAIVFAEFLCQQNNSILSWICVFVSRCLCVSLLLWYSFLGFFLVFYISRLTSRLTAVWVCGCVYCVCVCGWVGASIWFDF